MREIHENIYQLYVPFTGHTEDGIFAYLIKGDKRNLLVDTAMNTDGCEQALRRQLYELNVDLNATDIIVTHMHVDHSGLLGRLKNDNNIIYAGAKDKVYIDGYQEPPECWPWLLPNNIWTGTPAEHQVKMADHIACKYHPAGRIDIRPVEYGQKLHIGNYSFEVIDLSGHAAAHIGLWDSNAGILFCGDHILSNSFPNITVWNLTEDFLQNYLDNLEKLKAMPISHLFSAHDQLVEDVNARVDGAIRHYKNRLDHITQVLSCASRPRTAFDIASDLKRHGRLTDVPARIRWFICSDTLAYLQHLAFCGIALREDRGGTQYFQIR